jgi:hypothetical protein
MQYISDLNKFAKIKELASKGDEKAKDFLFNFMEMSDEEANAYLSSIAIKEEQQPEPQEDKEDWKPIVKALIKDENEAIDGYDKAIKFVTNSDMPDLIKTSYLEKLNHIKNEEIEHIEELKEIL